MIQEKNTEIIEKIGSLTDQIADMRKWRKEARIAFEEEDKKFADSEIALVEKRLNLRRKLQGYGCE